MDTEVAIESVRINGLFVLGGFNLEKCKGFLYPRTKKTVRYKRGLTVPETLGKTGIKSYW